MNFTTEKKSPLNFIAEAQEQITAAEKVHPCVTVTEPNWMALISTQKAQIELLLDIQNTLLTLTTEKELKAYMDEQLNTLIQYTEQTKEATEQFQRAMETSSEKLTKSIRQLTADTEKQVGRMKESCSQNISMLRSTAQDKLKRHTDRMFLISLIPSAVLIVLELMRHILSAISVI